MNAEGDVKFEEERFPHEMVALINVSPIYTFF